MAKSARAQAAAAYTEVEALGAIDLPVRSAELMAAARHLGQFCAQANDAFVACKTASHGDARKCIQEGATVTRCTRELYVPVLRHQRRTIR